jgi:hypothetical protein
MCFGSKSSSSKPAPSPQLPTFTPVRSEGTSAAERNRTGTQTGAPSTQNPSMPGSAMGSELGAVGTY